MSNIIWKQANGRIAVTSIFDDSTPQEHAALLQSRGDIPADWEAVAFRHEQFPANVPQDFWGWNGNEITADTVAYTKSKTLNEINSLEREQQMPRAQREFMLLSMQAQFTPEQLAQNPGYVAVKAFDDQIAALRAML